MYLYVFFSVLGAATRCQCETFKTLEDIVYEMESENATAGKLSKHLSRFLFSTVLTEDLGAVCAEL